MGMSNVASDLRNFAVIDPDNRATPRLKFLTEIRNRVFELKKAFEEKVIWFEAQKQTPEFVEQGNQKNLEHMEETIKKKRTKQDYEIKWERYQKYINKEKKKSIEYGNLKKEGLSGLLNFFKIRRLEREIGELKMKIAKTEKVLNKTRKIDLLD